VGSVIRPALVDTAAASPRRFARGPAHSCAQCRVIGSRERFAPRQFEQLAVTQRVRHIEAEDPMLARAEDLAGSAQPQVRLGDLKAVGGANHCVEPFPRIAADFLWRYQDANRFFAAPPDATAQLVELR